MKPRVVIPRDEWEPAELVAHWRPEGGMTDIRRLVERGDLKPYAFFSAPMLPATLVDDVTPVLTGEEATSPNRKLWLVQRLATKTHNWEYAYSVLCDRPDEGEGASYWALNEPIALSAALGFFVISDEDVRRYEAACGAGNAERNLDPRQERTRDILLVTMANELYGWRPWESERCTGATQVREAAQALGLDPPAVGSVRTHWKLAWERCGPTLNPSGDRVIPFNGSKPATATVN